MQTHGPRAGHESAKKTIGFIEAVISVGKEEGVKGYWKGNLAQVIRILPYSAVQLFAYESYKVHHGFFNAYNNSIVRSGILDGVSRAKATYGDLKIMVTRHSMGGAMAAFYGLDLALMYGSKNVQVMTFGMPRIGNAAFASYYSEVVPNTFRMTHEHDLVPHLPPYYQYFPQKTYHHGRRL